MELNDLKSAWNKIETPPKTIVELQLMLKENRHPVLKKIRKQLTLEIIGWSAFLLCYYTMFDGDQKPLFINIILVASIIMAIIYNFMGYGLAKYLAGGDSISVSLNRYFSKVKTYAVLSVFCRLLFVTGLLIFFTCNINFNTHKYFLLGFGIILLAFQLAVLGKIWVSRLRSLKRSLLSFS